MSVKLVRDALALLAKARLTMVAIWARVSRPLGRILPSDPLSRPFWTACVMAGADQSVGKSEKSDGTAAKALVDRSIAPINPIIMGLFLPLIRGTSYGKEIVARSGFPKVSRGRR